MELLKTFAFLVAVISKIMGLILASFAVQNILSGISEYFKLGA